MSDFKQPKQLTKLKSAMYIETGFLDAGKGTAFRTHADVCNYFGHNYKHHQRAIARHKVEPEFIIWFPKLYKNDDWDNTISGDEETIYERKKIDNDNFIRNSLNRPENFKRLIFAAIPDIFGRVTYRFKGVYEVDVETSRKTQTITHRRISKYAKTYVPAG